MLGKIGLFLGAAIAFIMLFPVLWIVAVLLAGVSTMVIGWAFPIVPDTLRELFNLPHLTNFQVGAILGFFGSAFKSYNHNSK